jgi:hypothetical protein
VLDDAKASAGQAALDPVQFSATSQTADAERQTVADETKVSAGQAALEPVQFSATSQTPALERQTVLDVRKASAGQDALDPLHVSARSQVPAAERHTVADEANPLAGQFWLTPSHVSATSHAPAAERHTVPDTAVPPPHTELEPVQVDEIEQAAAPVQAVPAVLNWQVALQHDADVPLAAPSSHCSLGCTEPLPQLAAWAGGVRARTRARTTRRRSERGRRGRASSVECMRGFSTAHASRSSE